MLLQAHLSQTHFWPLITLLRLTTWFLAFTLSEILRAGYFGIAHGALGLGQGFAGRTAGRLAVRAFLPPDRLPVPPALLAALAAEERATLASALAHDVDVKVLVIPSSALAAGAPFVQKALKESHVRIRIRILSHLKR